MTKELKKKLIGQEIKVIDEELNRETQQMEEKEVVVKVINFIKDDSIVIVEKQVKYSQKLAKYGDIKLEFTFPEKLAVDVQTNKVYDRNIYQTLVVENSKVFLDCLTQANKELEEKNDLVYIYRHYGPANKATFISSELIGIAKGLDEVKDITDKDTAEYIKEANMFDSRPQKFMYSISVGKSKYVEKSQGE